MTSSPHTCTFGTCRQITSELYSLWADTSLILFEYPLDYDFLVEGHWYHDPEIPDSSITWQYTVVPIDYTFQTMQYEVLYPLYMPEDVSNDGGRVSTPSNWKEIERESFKLAGMESELVGYESEGGRLSGINSYTPKGRISIEQRFQDPIITSGRITSWQLNVSQTIGLKGTKVKARFLTRTAKARTDTQGNFRMDKSFSSKVDYSIEFETDGYVVTNVLGWSTNHNRNGRTDNDWIMTLNYGAEYESWVRGTIMSAANDYKAEAIWHGMYYHKSTDNNRIKIRARFEAGRSNSFGVVRHSALAIDFYKANDIQFYSKDGNGDKLQTDEIYSLVMHEVAHTSHYLNSGPFQAGFSLGIVGESWAQCIEFYYTYPYYPDFVQARFPLLDISRTNIVGTGDDWKYTPAFIDLIDNTDQRGNITIRRGFDTWRPANEWADDRVSGYTLSQIEQALQQNHEFGDIRKFLINRFDNATENNIEALFSFYKDIEDNH